MKNILPTRSSLLFLVTVGLGTATASAGEDFLSDISMTKPAPTKAASGLYLRGYGGLNLLEDLDSSGFDAGWVAGGSLGYRFVNALGGLRIELDGSYSESEIDASKIYEGDLGLTTAALNVIHDFNTGTRLRPYLGFGLGAGFLNSDLTTGGRSLSESDDAVLLYQFIGGLEVEMGEKWSVFTEYRFVGLDDFTLNSGSRDLDGSDFGGHQLLFGARFSF
ncbi:MAG: opacity protein-like surface antigen [Verrucomicrobiales bacterium]|jgi:opacity protein-like surface antigen